MCKRFYLHWVIRLSYWEAGYLNRLWCSGEHRKPKKCPLFCSYNFLILILSGQLLIFITFHSCFLSIIYARASYLANSIATKTATYTHICVCKHTYHQPSMFPLLIIFSTINICSASMCVHKLRLWSDYTIP